jgi:predicted GNAT family acetyltransferase
LILTKCQDIDALPLIAQHAYETYGQLPGASGEKAIVAQFVAHWVKLTGHRAVVSMNERIYQNEQVIPPQGVSGSFRLATRDDFELLVKWGIAFTLEAFGTVNEAQVERTLRNRFDHNTGGYGLWMDDKGAEVSMAGYGGYTPNGVRIGPVYTPVEYRGRGYGRAVTAAVTQMHHDNGRRYVFLFTDLMNPTSNHIYMQIGYQPVTDVDEYRFEPAPATHV